MDVSEILEDFCQPFSREGELDPKSTCKEYLQVQKEGNRNVAREIKYYDLDIIISVGYHVKSPNGIMLEKRGKSCNFARSFSLGSV